MSAPLKFSWSRSNQNTLLISSPLILCVLGLALYRHLDPSNAISPDLGRYEQVYQAADFYGLWDYIAAFRFEPGFTIMFKLFHIVNLKFSDFLIINQIIYFGSLFLLLGRVTPSSLMYASMALVVSLFFPSHFLMSNNALRQAWAMALLFIALANLIKRLDLLPPQRAWRSAKFLIPLVLGIMFHYSLALIGILVVLALYLPQRLTLYVWIILTLLYCGNFFGGAGLLREYLYPILASNSTAEESALWVEYDLGFKASFLLMSIIPFLAWLWIKFSRTIISQSLSQLFSVYFLLCSFCFLLSFFPFHDRFFHYAWSVIPVILLGVFFEKIILTWRQKNYFYVEDM